ncbi:MAG: VanZ family protein [bacterium]
MVRKDRYILQPLVNLLLFDMLLVATPFLMLQNYLQHTVKNLSRASVNILNLDIPIILIIAIIFIIVVIYLNYKKITLFRLAVIFFVVLMMIVGQKTADYFINNKFYDLQHNWHYFAYGLFVFVMHRYISTKNISDSKIIIATFSKAFVISAFDEGIQVFISNRIFDISDIAKDMWGVTMGLILLFMILRNGEIIKNGWKFSHKKFKEYLSSPLSLLLLLLFLTYILLFISSILTEDYYWYVIALWTFPLFIIAFLFLHISGFKIGRIILLITLAIALSVLGTSYLSNHNDNITTCKKGYIVYDGIPLIYFDFMIYPDGSIRAVDKKTIYKGGDFMAFFNQKADIILIGRGFEDKGGYGFLGTRFVDYPYFIFNSVTNKNSQVVLLDTPAACREFNRMKKENKKVLFVIHNS